jgi:glucan 1,3-beta-glucosidase
MRLSGQQYVLKGMTFTSCTTAIVSSAFDLVVHDSSFSFVGTGIDAHGVSGSLTVLDTTTNQIGVLVTDSDSRGASRSIILENVVSSGPTVQFDGSSSPAFTGNVVGTWVHGDLVRLLPGDSAQRPY